MVGEVRAQARREAARIRARARRDAVQIAERLAELASVRKELDRVLEALGIESQGDRAGAAHAAPPPVGARRGEPPPADGVYEGEVEVEIGPLDDFAQLTGFEDAAAAIGGATEIKVKRFSGGRARLGMSLEQPVELLREREERSPLEFRVRALRGRELFLDVAGG
jgi:GAF domain-containing protein